MLDFQAARYLVKGEVAKQAGNNHPTSIPTGVFKTRRRPYQHRVDRPERSGERFCKAIEAARHGGQFPTMRTAPAAPRTRDALNAEIDRHTVKRSSAEWDRPAQPGGACRADRSIRSTRCLPTRRSKHVRMGAAGEEEQSSRWSANPSRLSRTPSKLDAPPPDLGQHTSAVLKQLGYSAKQIAALRKANAI